MFLPAGLTLKKRHNRRFCRQNMIQIITQNGFLVFNSCVPLAHSAVGVPNAPPRDGNSPEESRSASATGRARQAVSDGGKEAVDGLGRLTSRLW